MLEIRKQHPLNAVTLEKILNEQGTHIGHNKIHQILKKEGLVKDEPHKQRRRKWVRWASCSISREHPKTVFD